MTPPAVDREALVGVVIAGGFGIAWALWAAAGLTGGGAAAVRIAGVVIGVLIVVGAAWRHRAAGPGTAEPAPGRAPESMFRSRGYRMTVTAEVIALFAGNAVLGATGHGDYVAAWTAFVVGVHFIGFGRLFVTMFYWLGAAFVVAAVVGAAVGAVAGTRQAVEASTGLIAATSLFLAGGWGLAATPSAN